MASDRSNNFGALRLLFAYLVILSHSFELVDGNASRELLHRVTGTMTFGGLAINCFFIISGYLITASYVGSPSNLAYLAKRVLRIYPGYIVAFLLCAYALAPWVGGNAEPYHGTVSRDSLVANVLLLQPPEARGAFAGLHYAHLNGSTWTIRYEFVAYLVVMALGMAKLLTRRRLILGVTLALLGATMALFSAAKLGVPAPWIERAWSFTTEVRLLLMFASGALFYLFRDQIVYRRTYALVAAICLCALLMFERTAQAAIATFGAYLLFYIAFEVRSRRLASIGQKNDLSYGVYLYAWPVQMTLIWLDPAISAWSVFALACVGASLLGWASWLAVERPAMRLRVLLQSRHGRSSPVGSA